ncbi:CapA family protein [Pseudalkalibacillus berkeleyi]|uniref:CapA family protein n=1 Tax=Pseudalkalibacillus berkeleyi TaxID=1069813 RepID=A0ABS9H0J0_9BACL|nr:CapA family protein [Pseudalkalibacillus berkeleyi]MCF6138514.1 CapA family protein [Pseudalkalibacillus berkeleyi]
MKKVSIISFFVVITSLIFVLFINDQMLPNSEFTNETQPSPKAENNQTEKTEPPPIKEPKEVTTYASLMAVGDILIHARVYNVAAIGSQQYDFKPMLENVKPFLEKGDITIANQETMIGGSALGVSTYPRFNSPYEVGNALKDAGVDLVTIANNHTLDRGEKAIMNALDHWDSIGMAYTGSYRSEEDRSDLRLLEKNGIEFSFLSYTYGTNGIPVPESKPYLVNLIDADQIKTEVEKAKKLSDVVVLSLHFGNEYERLPNEQQKFLANEAASAGADIIIGHHPHVLQPPEWITWPDGKKTFVIYSLGNFLSGQRGNYKDIGGIVKIGVQKVVKGEQETITVQDPAFLPTWVDRSYLIHPMYQLKDKQNHYNEIKQHMSQWMPEIEFIESP